MLSLRFLSTATKTATKTAAEAVQATSSKLSVLSSECEVIPSGTIPQSPNRSTIWSPSQKSREEIFKKDTRFVGKDLSKQPQPLAAIDLIASVPIIKVHDRIAVCNGTDFVQGHPKVYINLDKPGAHSCGYCGLRYELDGDAHH
ncbi:hypothetical protein DAMA08_025150 [Martiniozyma asiatica (nom. inval.)]|nr:hypothetical protein DAMA08_025150 [Martiniozyma asiatica]